MEQRDAVNPAIEKIAVECEEAGATKWDVIRIVKALTDLNELDKETLREKTLELLQELNPTAAEVYSSFNKMQVRTSAEKIEHFDRGNIIRSLLRETDITRGVAEKIGAEVEDQIKDLKIDYLNASLIRALTDVKLLEYGHEEIHRQYARVGIPVYDMEQKLMEGTFKGKETLREYQWLRIIPREISNRHFRGELFINSVEDFSNKVYAYTYTPHNERATELEALLELSSKIIKFRDTVTLPVSLYGINYCFANLAEKLSKTKKKKFIEGLIKMLQLTYPSIERQLAPSVGINLYTSDFFDAKSQYKKTAIELGTIFIQQYSALKNPRFILQVSVDSRYKLKLIKSKHLPGIEFLNCVDHDFIPLNGHTHSKEILGYKGAIGINLPKIVKQANSVSPKVNVIARDLKESLNVLEGVREKQLQKRAYLTENGINISKLTSAFYLYAPSEKLNSLKIEKTGDFKKRFLEELSGDFSLTNYYSNLALERFDSDGKSQSNSDSCSVEQGVTTARSLKQAAEAIEKGIEHVVMQ